jgi:hypothetical protein
MLSVYFSEGSNSVSHCHPLLVIVIVKWKTGKSSRRNDKGGGADHCSLGGMLSKRCGWWNKREEVEEGFRQG